MQNKTQYQHNVGTKNTKKTQKRKKRNMNNANEDKISAYCALQLNDYTHHRLTILVLTSFSIALTSSAALGTSVEPCREASNAEDCKSPANE